MSFLWRKRKSGKKTAGVAPEMKEVSVPLHFRCPISLDLMSDPVTALTGITYDRQSIEAWLDMGNMTCPVTGRQLGDLDGLIPNHVLRKMIQEWCVAERPFGIERIPTPKIPVAGPQASEMLAEIEAASRQAEAARCQKLVGKVKALAKESERNRRCFASSGASRVLAVCFSTFAAAGAPAGLLEDVAATMPGVFPLDEEAARTMSSPEALAFLISMLNHRDLSGRSNAVLLLKEILAFVAAGESGNGLTKTAGLAEALVKMVKQPISPQATKASLVAIFYMVNYDEDAAPEFVELGLVPLLVETLVDAEKSMCERALAVLDGLLSCTHGRCQARTHALTTPALVKKMFRVSATATEFAVSATWKLCRKWGEDEGKGMEEGEREGCVVQALQVGAFQKLLLLLQVGCSGATKEKATELLKLLNGRRERAECIVSMDFKGLNRSS